MKINAKKLESFFHGVSTFRWIQTAATPNSIDEYSDVAGYLNPLHSQLIHFVSNNEHNYLHSLSEQAQVNLISALISQHALYLIFENPEHIPKPFYQQKKIHLLCVDTIHTQQIQQLTSKLNKRFAERHAQHGAFVIVYGRGIFIRGKSGAGKSQLLLNLIKNNHLWVADDLTNFYLNTQGQIIGEADNNLSEYIHIKGVGPIHVDKTYGQACRIRSHSLAAAIHLSDNIPQENPHISAYSQLDTLTLLNKKLPLWHFSSSNHNLPLLVEQCAKNLILEAWGHNAADGLENALNNALSRAQNNDSK